MGTGPPSFGTKPRPKGNQAKETRCPISRSQILSSRFSAPTGPRRAASLTCWKLCWRASGSICQGARASAGSGRHHARGDRPCLAPYGNASLAEEWTRQIGGDALRVAAAYDEPAFLQPPTGEPTKRQSMESLDCLFPGAQHEVKETFSGSTEEWLFALMGGQTRPSVNFHRPSSRHGLTATLPSTDGTMGSEIRSLIEAYDRTMKMREGSAADHMVWLRRFNRDSSSFNAADLPRPVLDMGRPVRLRFTDGRIEAWLHPTNVYRLNGPAQWMEDPHTPKLVTAKAVERFRLAAKPWDHTIQHQILFGGVRRKRRGPAPRYPPRGRLPLRQDLRPGNGPR